MVVEDRSIVEFMKILHQEISLLRKMSIFKLYGRKISHKVEYSNVKKKTDKSWLLILPSMGIL